MDDEKFDGDELNEDREYEPGEDDSDDFEEDSPEMRRLRGLSDEELEAEIQEYDRQCKEIEAELFALDFKEYLTPEECAAVNWADNDAINAARDLAARRKAEQDAARDREIEAKAFQKVFREGSSQPEQFEEAARCEHIKANNQQCGSPAMGGRRFCYFHSQTHDGRKRKKPMRVPVLEDQQSIQLAATRVCQAVADESLDPKRAATLLYGLQVAGNAVKQIKPVAKSRRRK
jgi:hypothetical protein